MSISAVRKIIAGSRSRGPARAVLIIIALHLNEKSTDRPAWPGVETIAREAGVSVRTVQRAIVTLEALGELEIDRQAGPSGTHFYRLGAALSGENGDAQDDTVGEAGNVKASPPLGCQSDTGAPDDTMSEAGGDRVTPPFRVSECHPPGVRVTPPLGCQSDTLTREQELNKKEQEGGAGNTLPAPGAEGDCVAPAPLPHDRETGETAKDEKPLKVKGETTMTEKTGFEGERPKSWAAALRFLLDLTDVPERDFRRSGPIATVARRWVDGEISEAEARRLAAEIARREVAA